MPRAFARHGFSSLVIAAAGAGCLVGVSVGLGCGETISPNTTRVVATSEDVLAPKASEPAKPATPSAKPSETAPQDAEPKVTLVRYNFNDFKSKVATNSKAKLTIVDAWATNCGPCKENFPHLVEMHHKYAKDGLAVVSLSLDDISAPKDIAQAEKFLKEKKATFTNVLLDEELGVGFEKLDINAIPAVFLFGPDGKEIKRFTLDDPDNQFTYAEVEETVAALLKGKLVPEKKK